MSRIFVEGGSQCYPKRLDATPESIALVQEHRDVTAHYFDIRKNGMITEQGYMLFSGQHRMLCDINTFSWKESRSSEAWYARLCKEIEEQLGKTELVIVEH